MRPTVSSTPPQSPAKPSEPAADAPPVSGGIRDGGLGRFVRTTVARHRAFCLVAAAFVISAFVVPTLAPVSVSDDALYLRSVETLLREGKFTVLPLSAVPQVFQTAWAALFGLVFGDSLGVFRASMVALVLLGGWAAYGLCRELGVDASRSALGAALYLFNPLSYVLSFTFMSDAPATAIVVIAVYCYAHGLRTGDENAWWLIAGSVGCAAAFLVRQPGGLVAVAVATYLVASRRARPDRQGLALIARVLVVPAATVGAYLGWAYLLDGVPPGAAQGYVAGQLSESASSALWIGNVLFVESVYPGFFVLPVALAVLGSAVAVVRRTRFLGWLAVSTWALVLLYGLLTNENRAMPYFSSFVTTSGLGPAFDLRGGRSPIFGLEARVTLSVLCMIAALVVLLAVCRRLHVVDPPERDRAVLVIWVLAFQAVGVLASSTALRNDPAASRDRYLLPLLPLVVCLALWAVRNLRLVAPVAWAGAVVFAVYSVAGTHDSLTMQAAAWDLGHQARADGVALGQLDVGAGWAAYHRYERARGSDATAPALRPGLVGPPLGSEHDAGAWWLTFYESGIVPRYIVSNEELLGYTTVRRREYSSWLRIEPTYVYIVRAPDAPYPP